MGCGVARNSENTEKLQVVVESIVPPNNQQEQQREILHLPQPPPKSPNSEILDIERPVDTYENFGNAKEDSIVVQDAPAKAPRADELHRGNSLDHNTNLREKEQLGQPLKEEFKLFIANSGNLAAIQDEIRDIMGPRKPSESSSILEPPLDSCKTKNQLMEEALKATELD